MLLDEFAGLLKGSKRTSEGGYTALCPAHNDTSPSLSADKAEDGRILVKCFAGCSFEEIAQALSLQPRDFFSANGKDREPTHKHRPTHKTEDPQAKPISEDTVDAFHAALDAKNQRECLSKNRGLSSEVIDAYKIGYENRAGGGRVTIPIRDERGAIADIRRWLPPEHRKGEGSKKMLHWKKGYGAPRLFPVDQLKEDRLVFCEGELDALGLISHGIAAITVTAGASTAPPKSQAQLFKNKRVVFLMDHDEAGKKGAQLRAEALAPYADIEIASWPEGRPTGWDVTDELIQHGVESIHKILAAAASYEPAPNRQDMYPYAIEDKCLGWMKSMGRGDNMTVAFVPLCNFVARVTEDQQLDNGIEKSRSFVVELQIKNGPKYTIDVAAHLFSAMRWVVPEVGASARVSAGLGAQDKLREAIQANSTDIKSLSAFAHTGWREIEGRKLFLHSGRTDVKVELEAPLDRYALPEHPANIEDALRRSLALLDTAADSITIPLLAAMYLAPLCELLQIDFSLFLVGKTGSLKSSLAALFLCHYGNFPDKTALPASWASTDNALERRLSMLKDVPCVIDDYAPSTDAHAQRKQARTAERILRGTGNLSERSRLNANLSERPTYKPRGLLISTGEDLPPGQSILARTLTIEVEKMLINMPALTEAQNNADELPNALAAYVEWLTPQLDEYKQSLPAMWRQHRTRFAKTASHLRIPETLAHLSIGIDLLTNFVRDRDVLNQEEIEALADRAQTTLLTLGLKHGQRVQEEDPAEVFLTTLRAMLVQGSATLVQKGNYNRPLGMVGWQDGENALLIPAVVRQAVVSFVREAGNHFPHSSRALNESLEARGVLKKNAQGKLSRLVKIQGKNQRVLEIPMKYLAD